MTMKNFLSETPVVYENKKINNLNEASELFWEFFVEYARKNDLSEEQIEEFKRLFKEVLLEKKLEYFIEKRISDLFEPIGQSIENSLNAFNPQEKKVNDSFTRIIYYNNKKHRISNER